MRFCPKLELGGGAEHHVGVLDQGTLIKWPKPGTKVSRKPASTMKEHLDLLAALDVRMPETQVIANPEIVLPTGSVHVPYCMLARRVEGRPFTRADVARPEIRRDLAVVIDASRVLSQRGLDLDLFYCRSAVKFLDPERALGENLLTTEAGLFFIDPSLRVLAEGTPKQKIAMKVHSAVQQALGELLLLSY